MLRTLIVAIFLIGFLPAQAADLTQHEVMSEGHPLTLWEKSAPSPKATLLLLHGRTYSSLPDFDLVTESENLSMMDALVTRGYRVLALDARGYGATPRDETGWLTPNQAVEDVVTVLRWIKTTYQQPPSVFGWSYGSMVAQLTAQRHPEALEAILLFGYPFDPQRHVVSEDHEYPATAPAKPNTAKHAASDFVVPGVISQEAIDAYVDAALAADPVRVDFRALHQWAELDASQVTIPTLLIQGQFDPIAPDSIQQNLFLNLGTADKWWVVLAQGSHAALLETPRHEMFAAMDVFIEQRLNGR